MGEHRPIVSTLICLVDNAKMECAAEFSLEPHFFTPWTTWTRCTILCQGVNAVSHLHFLLIIYCSHGFSEKPATANENSKHHLLNRYTELNVRRSDAIIVCRHHRYTYSDWNRRFGVSLWKSEERDHENLCWCCRDSEWLLVYEIHAHIDNKKKT